MSAPVALQRLSALAPLVAHDAEQADREGRLTPAVAAALAASDLYRLWVPRTLGGAELALPDAFEVFQAAARLDGAFGWAVTIGTGGGLFGATMQPETAAEIFTPSNALIAGSGHPGGVAVEVPGGYRVTGRWPYASGAHQATWFTASCVVHDGAGPRTAAAGAPLIRAVAVPAAEVTILDTWHVLGMRGTGSHDFRIDARIVPARRTFDVFGPPFEPGPLYRYPFRSVAEVSFAAVALGVARHAIDAFDILAANKRPYGFDGPLADAPVTRIRRAEALASWHAADAAVRKTVSETWATVVGGASLGDDESALVARACRAAAASAAHAVDSLYALSGMSPLFPGSEFGRCWRDLHTVCQHTALSPLGLA